MQSKHEDLVVDDKVEVSYFCSKCVEEYGDDYEWKSDELSIAPSKKRVNKEPYSKMEKLGRAHECQHKFAIEQVDNKKYTSIKFVITDCPFEPKK